MKIVVCIKTVPQSLGRLRVSDTGDKVVCEGSLVTVNESDRDALEEAVALREKVPSEVTVITAGSMKSQEGLYAGLARGADQAVRVDADFGDQGLQSEALARAIRRLDYDLILTGMESWDNLAARTGVSIAVKLGLPFAYGVTRVEPVGSDWIAVTKELGGGAYQSLEMSLPALLCIQSGIRPVPYVPAIKLLQARRRQIQTVSLRDLDMSGTETSNAGWFRITEVFSPEKTRNVQMIEGKPADVASVLIQKVGEAMQ